MGWALLLVAGAFEVGFTTALKASDGFSKPVPSLLFVVSAVLSFVFLNMALRHLPLGTAYAVWVGIGAVGTVAIGILVYDEPTGLPRMFFVGLLIASIIGLKLVSE